MGEGPCGQTGQRNSVISEISCQWSVGSCQWAVVSDQWVSPWEGEAPAEPKGPGSAAPSWCSVVPGGASSGAFVRGPSASCKWVVRGVTFWRVVQPRGNRMPASTGETAAPQITKGFWCEGQNKQAYSTGQRSLSATSRACAKRTMVLRCGLHCRFSMLLMAGWPTAVINASCS